MYHHESYKKHEEWYNKHFPSEEAKVAVLKSINQGTINNWLQSIFFSCIDPLLKAGELSWLTIGDAYGFDANYILNAGTKNVEASDLNDDFLKIAKENNIIDRHSAQNAENLAFRDNTFDYVLCKETYHHFPRPYAALYEMIRVAKKGMVIIEPQDPIIKMPSLLAMLNIVNKFNPALMKKIWKNQISYEPVGNFIYKVSEREFIKFAAGLNLPAVAFKQINPHFYSEKTANLKASNTEKGFRKIKFRKNIADWLVKLTIIPGQVLSTIVFKEFPDAELTHTLEKSGYRIVTIPKNPYL